MHHIFTFRIGSAEDFTQLKALAFVSYKQFRNVLTPDNWEKLQHGLQDEDRLLKLINKSIVFICEEGQKVVGAAYLVPHGNPTSIFQSDWCYIRLVGVDPEYRGFGIAKKLTQSCIKHAREMNESTMALHTSEFMNAARHIYERLGFKKVKEIEPIFGKRYWLYTLKLTE